MADYYTASADPADNTDAEPLVLRNEHAAIAAGFDKLPVLSGNADKTVVINSSGTAQTVKTAAEMRTLLGLVIGTNVQAQDADLDAIAALAKTDNNFIVGNGSAWVAESGATARASLGATATGDAVFVAASAAAARAAIGAATDTDLVHISGTETITGPKKCVNLGMTGEIKLWASATLPVTGGWLVCDGAAVSRTTYADLFAITSTTFGVGDGSTTFNVPDLRRKVPVGSGGTGTATLGNVVGNTGGAETHLLTGNESGIQAHSHAAQQQGAPDSIVTGGPATLYLNSGNTSATGPTDAISAHNNMQPSLVINFIIKT